MSLGGQKGSSRQSRTVDIPAFLQPFVTQAAGTAGRALTGLERLGPDNLVAGLAPEQEAALNLATDRALGDGGFIPTAQTELLRTARGVPISEFLPTDTLASLSGFGRAPEDVLGTDVVERLTRTGLLPASSVETLTGAQSAGLPAGTDALSVNPGLSEFLPAASRAALESTAEGDFLFGGEGFDQAVDAAVRSALPQIRSVFGSAGAGGATGGLAQSAVGQAAIDAFASQFGAERGRQLSAADRLASLALADRGQAIDAGSRLAGIDLANRGQQQDAAATLANLGLLENEQGIRGAGLLGDFISGERQRELSASGLLADIANSERGRALDATGLLPDAALLDVNLLDQVGTTRQAQEERELRAPIDFNQLLLAAALNGLPIQSLLGDTTRGRQRGFGFAGLSFGG